MLFESADQFRALDRKAVTVFGMAGVGKTRLGNLLRRSDWFHFSVDFRIGTRHMGEYIVDNFKHHAMKVPFLAELLRSDSIYISSNITFDNLEPLSTYLGTPGDPEKGGLPFAEYQRRQEQHRVAEVYSLLDVPYFIERAKDLYDYDSFLCDTGGSLIEVLDPHNPEDPVVKALTEHTVLLYLKGSEQDAHKLVSRFKAQPKPMYYPPDFLVAKWEEFKSANGVANDNDVDPDAFAVWGFEALLKDRLPRYQALADNFGYEVEATDLAAVKNESEFIELMCSAIDAKNA
ncbi:ATPase [Pelagibacterium xiamenense]|uniref:ATPase n=1 Tax=Pelagibacterium xiamenense TaxID=2901140 RepID=UPI001E62F3B4|nr:ATPase [Pelagibacterium xiamenense]MCD7060033.1 ATPase [Pelagibacterium xiamenense]